MIVAVVSLLLVVFYAFKDQSDGNLLDVPTNVSKEVRAAQMLGEPAICYFIVEILHTLSFPTVDYISKTNYHSCEHKPTGIIIGKALVRVSGMRLTPWQLGMRC